MEFFQGNERGVQVMFQPQSINTDGFADFLEDLKHQLFLNPDMSAQQVLDELEDGKCLKGDMEAVFRLCTNYQVAKEAHNLRESLDEIKDRVNGLIGVVAK